MLRAAAKPRKLDLSLAVTDLTSTCGCDSKSPEWAWEDWPSTEIFGLIRGALRVSNEGLETPSPPGSKKR